MRNIFDQYVQPENRITHALMTALNEDRVLLGRFLDELVKVDSPTRPADLLVREQQYPGEDEPGEDELETRGIPDGWIFNEDGWCVFIESKVLIRPVAAQIESHRRTAARRGFKEVTAVVIAPRAPSSAPSNGVFLEWRTVYSWLRRQSSTSTWAARAAEYLEIIEAKMIDSEQFVEGTLTMFAGFQFGRDHPFTYLEGKRVLGLAMGELRKRSDLKSMLGMNPAHPGRGAITGRKEDRVWDFLSLSPLKDNDSFTKHPHLTLGLHADFVEAMVTVPNAVNNVMRANIIGLGEHGIRSLVEKVVRNLSPLLRAQDGARPWFRGVQRRYPSQRAKPFLDARIEFDLRTAFRSDSAPKTQLRWLSAAYDCFVNKEGSNYQIQVGVLFPYDHCPALKGESAIDLIAKAWIACKPLVDLAR